MKKMVLFVFMVFFPLLVWGQNLIEKIEIVGNDRVSDETIEYYVTVRAGDFYNRDQLLRDFKVLWSTGFFSNIKIEEDEGQSGRIVRIIVEENPVIKDIVYKTGKKVKEDDIVNRLKEDDSYVMPYSYYSPHRIQRIKKTILDLMAEKGLASAKVEEEINRKGENELEIVIKIDEGPKVRVGEIVFEGPTKLAPGLLKRAFKENRKHGFLSWILGKDTYKENKLSEDLDNLKATFQEHGYMEASIGEPQIVEVTKRSILFKKQTMKKLVIPVNPGTRYSFGEVKIEGNKVFSSDGLLSMVPYEQDKMYSTDVREKAVEKMGELYRNFGYLYAQIIPVENLDPVNKKVNLTFNIYEGEVVYLNRLEFKGNTFTKDKVIRREMMLNEGDRLSLALFKDSILRMKQLGLVEVDQEPTFEQEPGDPTKMNVTLNVTELQRNNIQFTAGYSGYQGTFVALSYSTVNFLGAGENLELMLQYGKRIKNYTFGFTEPWLFDLPINVGFSVHNRYMYYPYLFTQKSKGANFHIAGRLFRYWRASLNYGYEFLDIGAADEEGDDYYPYNPYYGGGYGGYGGYGGGYGYSPYYYGGGYTYGNYNISSITPSIYRNTVDSPLTPSQGTLYMVSCKFAGGILGGDISLIKPRFEWTYYQPIIKNQALGFHIEYQLTKPLKGSEVPFWERYYLGGEQSIRGYDIYTIGPRSESGYNLGGEKALVFNAEYIMPLGGPLYAILFYDVGNAFARDENVSLRNLYSSSGLEMRIFVPAIRVPFRLIFAYNSHRIRQGDTNFAFRFAIGTTF